jgi:outer membrane beta-barrel protein
MTRINKTSVLLLSALISVNAASAAEKKTKPEQADVSAIKDRYWAQGDENELAVVQNRLYSKAGKVELGGFGAILATDPFLDVYGVGGSLGYHFNEFWALHVFGWKANVSDSAALNTLRATGQDANVNRPESFYGAEVGASILYGKLSLLGKKILYYDFHLLGGAGMTKTDSGTYFTPSIGLGQQIYLAEWVSLRVDYRLMPYKEKIIEQVKLVGRGTVVEERTNWTNAVTLGVTFMIGG